MTPEEAGALIHALADAFAVGDVDAVIGQFATAGDIMYAGSERGEVAVGLTDLRLLLTDLFDRAERYTWRCESVHVTACAAGFALLADATLFIDPRPRTADATGEATLPYRVSGLLENEDGNWRWRFCHGSEPAAPATG
jgi:SnoaL-like protein